MGARGPAPKPRLAVVREGGKVRSQHRSQPVVPPGAPSEPDWSAEFGVDDQMAGWASTEWARVVPAWDALRMLTSLDRAVLADHCVAWAQLRLLLTILADEGQFIERRDGKVTHPAMQQLSQVRARLAATAKALGLSPADRARLSTGGSGDDGGTSSEGFTV